MVQQGASYSNPKNHERIAATQTETEVRSSKVSIDLKVGKCISAAPLSTWDRRATCNVEIRLYECIGIIYSYLPTGCVGESLEI